MPTARRASGSGCQSCRYNRTMSIAFRTATPADADAAAPLIYSSGNAQAAVANHRRMVLPLSGRA